MASLKEYRDEQLEKLAKLRSLGVDPYPAKSFRDTSAAEILDNPDEKMGQGACAAGRVVGHREHGGVQFIDIDDEGKVLQLIVHEGTLSPQYEKGLLGYEYLNLLTRGDFVEAAGTVAESKTGQISLDVKGLRILTKVLRPLPDTKDGFTNIETRYRQRYVDMHVNKDARQVMDARIATVKAMRRFLDDRGFVDIETPVLQPIYGGASANPFVTHHKKLDTDLFLRISDELYLKRAVVAGFNKVYEFGHDFRNEGIDPTHNPEFTMLEFYWAYADYNDLMDMTEEMLSHATKEVTGSTKVQYNGKEIDFAGPYPRIKFRDAILEHSGVDINEVDRDQLVAEIKSRGLDIDLSTNPPMKDLLDDFYKHTTRPNLVGPLFMLDYPAEMIPLAKLSDDDPTKGATMQLVVDGAEIIKAYNELNDPGLQLANWTSEQEVLDAGESDEAQPIDFDFIRALEFGMPPTAGWGLGIDRFIQIITDQDTIKETILFPTLRPEKFDPTEFGLEAKKSSSGRLQDKSRRIVAVVRKDLENWQVANAAAHMTAYIGNKMAKDEFDSGDHFMTHDGYKLPRPSQHPILIKKAEAKDLRKLYRKSLETPSVKAHVFVREMIDSNDDAEVAQLLLAQNIDEVEIYGIALYGDNDEVNALTKSYRLWS